MDVMYTTTCPKVLYKLGMHLKMQKNEKSWLNISASINPSVCIQNVCMNKKFHMKQFGCNLLLSDLSYSVFNQSVSASISLSLCTRYIFLCFHPDCISQKLKRDVFNGIALIQTQTLYLIYQYIELSLKYEHALYILPL